jgi:hypothetical protein
MMIKEKQYDPAGQNEQAPEKGMAAVNTFHPEEEAPEQPLNVPKPGESGSEDSSKNIDKK